MHFGQRRMKHPRVAFGLLNQIAKQIFQHLCIRWVGVRRDIIGYFADFQGNRRVEPVLRR